MVRRGSTVRVRQRALKPPQTGIFVVSVDMKELLLCKEGLSRSAVPRNAAEPLAQAADETSTRGETDWCPLGTGFGDVSLVLGSFIGAETDNAHSPLNGERRRRPRRARRPSGRGRPRPRSPRRGHRSSRPVAAITASSMIARPGMAAPTMSNLRRSSRSASAPPTSENANSGSGCASPTTASAVGAFESAYTCHATATSDAVPHEGDRLADPVETEVALRERDQDPRPDEGGRPPPPRLVGHAPSLSRRPLPHPELVYQRPVLRAVLVVARALRDKVEGLRNVERHDGRRVDDGAVDS